MTPPLEYHGSLRTGTMLKEPRVTVKIPRPLYRRIQQVIENSGFSSPTDFIVYVIRDLVSEVESKQTKPGADPDFTPEELDAVRQKLKNLGYL